MNLSIFSTIKPLDLMKQNFQNGCITITVPAEIVNLYLNLCRLKKEGVETGVKHLPALKQGISLATLRS